MENGKDYDIDAELRALVELGVMPWSEVGACNAPEVDYALFFPDLEENEQKRRSRTKMAKAICERCVVTDYCLDEALQTRQPVGIWGGLDEKERRKLKPYERPYINRRRVS